MSRMWHTHQGSIMGIIAISIRRGSGIVRLSRIMTMMRLIMMLGRIPRIMPRVIRLSQMPVTMMGMIIMLLCRRMGIGIGHMMCPRIVHLWMALLMMIWIRLSLRRRCFVSLLSLSILCMCSIECRGLMIMLRLRLTIPYLNIDVRIGHCWWRRRRERISSRDIIEVRLSFFAADV